MEYMRVGNSGLKVSKIILGCMSFGDPDSNMEWSLPEEEALKVIKHAYDIGINTWDTADVYSLGDSERIIGTALKKFNIPRHRVVIMTKCYSGVPEKHESEGKGPEELFKLYTQNDGIMVNRLGLSRKHIMDAVDASISRLGTYIDILQIHRLDPESPPEEIMRALNDLVESGKVRYLGTSTMQAWELQNLQNIAKRNGWHQFISMQEYYSLIYREAEREHIPYCKHDGIGITPYSPLARGNLARPWNSERTYRQDRDATAGFMLGAITEADIQTINRVEELAKKKGIPMVVIALAWILYKGMPPIVGVNSIERLNEAASAVTVMKEGKLTVEDFKYLEEVYAPKGIIRIA